MTTRPFYYAVKNIKSDIVFTATIKAENEGKADQKAAKKFKNPPYQILKRWEDLHYPTYFS